MKYSLLKGNLLPKTAQPPRPEKLDIKFELISNFLLNFYPSLNPRFLWYLKGNIFDVIQNVSNFAFSFFISFRSVSLFYNHFSASTNNGTHSGALSGSKDTPANTILSGFWPKIPVQEGFLVFYSTSNFFIFQCFIRSNQISIK